MPLNLVSPYKIGTLVIKDLSLMSGIKDIC